MSKETNRSISGECGEEKAEHWGSLGGQEALGRGGFPAQTGGAAEAALESGRVPCWGHWGRDRAAGSQRVLGQDGALGRSLLPPSPGREAELGTHHASRPLHPLLSAATLSDSWWPQLPTVGVHRFTPNYVAAALANQGPWEHGVLLFTAAGGVLLPRVPFPAG